MRTPRMYLACVWGVAALVALYYGIAHGSDLAWQILLALVPSLVVFAWWIADRAALERRITRLEARSEIGYERRVIGITNLENVEHRVRDVEARVTVVEHNEVGAAKSQTLPK